MIYRGFVDYCGGIRLNLGCDFDFVLLSPIVVLSVRALVSGAALSWVIFIIPQIVVLPLSLKISTLLVVIVAFFLIAGVVYSESFNSVKLCLY